MAKDVNPTYRRMAYETGPVEGKLLYEDFSQINERCLCNRENIRQLQQPQVLDKQEVQRHQLDDNQVGCAKFKAGGLIFFCLERWLE